MRDPQPPPAPERPEEPGSAAGSGAVFRLGHVPGTTPGKWVRTWRERRSTPLELVAVEAVDAPAALLRGEADAALLRPPVDPATMSAIPLYEEVAVVVVSRDHLLAALEPDETVTAADLDDEVLLRPFDDVVPWAADDRLPGRPGVERPATTRAAVELVAAGVGVLVVPQSLARLHHRKDVTYRILDGGPASPVSLAWVTDRASEDVEEFIGIVRGRTVNSSRGRTAPEPSDGDRTRGSGAGGRAGAGRAAGSGGTHGRAGRGRASGGRTTGRHPRGRRRG